MNGSPLSGTVDPQSGHSGDLSKERHPDPRRQRTGNDKLNGPSQYWRLPGAALAFYALLAFLILYPILFATGTHVAGFDFFNYHWNFWWLRFAPATPGLSVYETNFTMFPYTTNLGYHALTAFWYPLWAVLEPVVGTLAAMNAIIYVACVLNGFLLFVLLRREGAPAATALLGGAALQAAPTLRYFYYNTHINLMDWFWLPALLLIWGELARAVDRGRWRAVVIAAGFGLALWGLTLTDLQFPIFAAFLLVPYGLLTVWRSRRRAALIALGILSVAIAFTLLWFAGPFPHLLEFEGTLAPGIVEDRPGIPLPAGFLRMSDAWWEWSAPSAGAWITTAIILGLLAAWINRRRIRWNAWFWFALMLPPLIFALGPTLNLGDLEVPLPFRVLHAQTNGMFRMPWRLLPIAIVAAMLFVALVFKPLLIRWRTALPWVVSAALLLLAADVRLFESAPLIPVPAEYEIYRTIRQETGSEYDDEVVIEIPTGAASGEVIFGDPRATQLQWYTLTHQKRIVNGFISRAPLEHFYYLETDDPMLSWLGQRRYLDRPAVEAQMRERIESWQIGYFVLHRDLVGRDAPAIQEIIGFFNSLDDLLCPHSVEGDVVAFRTRRHPAGCPARIPALDDSGVYVIDIGSEADVRHIGTGWYYAENVFDVSLRWAGEQPEAILYADLLPGAYTAQIEAQAYFEPRTVRLVVNGVDIAEPVVLQADALQTIEFQIPEDAIGSGRHVTLTLHYDAWRVPADIQGGGDQRRLAIAVDSVRFMPDQSQLEG